MGRFIRELKIIGTTAAAVPTLCLLVTAGLWYGTDSQTVMTVYLAAVLVLFVVCLAASLRDEMDRTEVRGNGRR